MVSSIAIPSIIGVIMAVVTSSGMSKTHITSANINKGNTFGISTKTVVFKFLIKNNKAKKPTMKAAKNDLNCVCKINLFN